MEEAASFSLIISCIKRSRVLKVSLFKEVIYFSICIYTGVMKGILQK